MPMSDSAPPDPTNPLDLINPIAVSCAQGFLGLLLGGAASLILTLADPFGITTFTEPQGADIAQRAAAFAQWKNSIGVIIGGLTMTLVPLLVSGTCGVFVHKSRPISIPAALFRMVGVVFLLLPVSWFGLQAIDRWLWPDDSSSVRAGVVGLAFQALCISLAAPLSSAFTRRRLPVAKGRWAVPTLQI
jgi:hypothetical protein